jgi:hypothetical protein
MPCGDMRDMSTNQDYENQIAVLRKDNRQLEAALCAVFNELEKDGVLDDIIAVASKNADIDLAAIWKRHVSADMDRLKRDLSQYSEHELNMLKKIIDSLSNTK